MQTERGFNLLQSAADDAADWHDENNDGKEHVIVMTLLINSQNAMLNGCKLARHPKKAQSLFRTWAQAYDALFMEGYRYGIVPVDPIHHSDLPPR